MKRAALPTTIIQIVTEEEWNSVSASMRHDDVDEAITLLKETVRVKFPCPEGLQHKKRESARQKAGSRGMKVLTMWKDGYLYLKKIGVTE